MNTTQTCHSEGWQQLRSWLLLSFQKGLGSVRFRALLQEFGSPEAVFSAPYTALRAALPEKLADAIASNSENRATLRKLDNVRNWLESSDAHHIISLRSPNYPPLLRELSDPPPILYIIGNPELLTEPQLAIVGSRRATPQAQKLAREMAKELSKSGLVITSGMALGIDAAAHQGVIESYGSTVAVLGAGIDVVYPRSHHQLYSAIALQGALVSEFPLGTVPAPGNFPRRNRIITGLSLGVLVVEAALKSGSLVSARLAAEQGREVFAVPGSVFNPLSRGCHKLIKDGATLVESPQDILLELESYLRPMLKDSVSSGSSEPINAAHQELLGQMGYDIVSIDILSQVSGMACDELSVLLTELEMDGLIQSVPGGFLRT